MIRFLCLSVCCAAVLVADNFINSEAWAKEDESLIDRRFPSQDLSNLPLTMPKTPLPSIEPIFGDEAIGETAQSEPIFEPAPPPNNGKIGDGETGSFWIQIGAFANAQSADDLSRKLTAEGYVAKVFAKELNRVAVGPFESANQAEASLYRIRTIYADAFITAIDRLDR
ncbi:MAG: SPOR domain-containing protein [Helicobacteraceae bacterium]|jgi:cell division septation protein DedD|nr:SPOR domain-containing protein [Helicobacteraceae bacterium]